MNSMMFTVVVGLSLLHMVSANGLNSVCSDKPVDITLVIDESNSIWSVHFNQLRNFLADISESFSLGSNGTRFSALTFGNVPRKIFSFDDYSDRNELSAAIRAIQQAGGTRTNTHLALELVRTSEVPMMRLDTAHVMIFVTDGVSREPERTREESEALAASGITSFVVGISTQVNDAENEMIASDPDNSHYFKIDSFEDLSTTLARLVAVQTCEQIPNDEPQPCVADVIFNLATIYTGLYNSETYLNVTTLLVEKFIHYDLDKKYKNITVGIYPQSCYPRIGVPLSSCGEFVTRQLKMVKYSRPSVSTHITDMVTEGFTLANGARTGVKKVGIIIVDQGVADSVAVEQAVSQATLNGIDLIAIGIGKDVDDSLLALLVGGVSNRQFSLSATPDEAELDSLLQRLYAIVCA